MKCLFCNLEMQKFDLGDGWFKEVCVFHANVRSVYKDEIIDVIFSQGNEK